MGLDGKIIGLVAIQDVPKPSSKDAIKELKARGLMTVMLTGDNKRVAQAIADEVGIDRVIAEVMPNDKAQQIKELQDKGKKSPLLVMELMMPLRYRQLMLELRWDPELILQLTLVELSSFEMIYEELCGHLIFLRRPLTGLN